MSRTIGIRREDKNTWERRVPLTPEDLAALGRNHNLDFIVQPSPIRIHEDAAYVSAGAEVAEDLSRAGVIIAVKEVPAELLLAGKTYVYFSHVIKGQPYNMAMLQRLRDLGCSLVDYERISDAENRRLIFFSHHAGYAGMLETLWALGQRLKSEGIPTPLAKMRRAHAYDGLRAAKAHLTTLGEQIARDGLDPRVSPLILGVAGYGNVAKGCQEILACLPITELTPAELPAAAARQLQSDTPLFKVELKEEHMVRPRDPAAPFALLDYYDHPVKYEGCFEDHLPHLDVLVNTIYWEERYPRLVTRAWVQKTWAKGRKPRLKVIGDISCDIEGSVEVTLKATGPDEPNYVYEPATGQIRPGVEGHGPVVMAVDNLPCELPRAASRHFSESLRDMLPPLAAANWSASFDDLELPPHLKKAVIVHRGELTDAYRYLEEFLRG